MILDGKRILVTGVVNRRSIAFAIAERAQRAGAEVLLTSFGRVRRMTERAARRACPSRPRCSSSTSTATATSTALHRRASRPLGRDRRRRPRDRLRARGRARRPVPDGAARERRRGLRDQRLLAEGARRGARRRCFGRRRAASSASTSTPRSRGRPTTGWASSKAALESVSRYLARDLGPARRARQPRLRRPDARPSPPAASPASRRSPSAGGSRRPLGWDPTTRRPVADAALFLLSDLARGDHRRDPPRRRRLPRDGGAAGGGLEGRPARMGGWNPRARAPRYPRATW